MDILIKLVIAAVVLAFFVWVLTTHGYSNRFLYVDKRKKDVTLHLTIFGTPRGKGAARKVIASLEDCLKKLKNDGYTSVTLESHLIDEKKMKMVSRITGSYNYKITNVSTFPTPRWQRFFIPFSMAFFRFKLVRANELSTKITILL